MPAYMPTLPASQEIEAGDSRTTYIRVQEHSSMKDDLSNECGPATFVSYTTKSLVTQKGIEKVEFQSLGISG